MYTYLYRLAGVSHPEAFHDGFFRFSVGIEDAEDIIADLQQALEQEGLL